MIYTPPLTEFNTFSGRILPHHNCPKEMKKSLFDPSVGSRRLSVWSTSCVEKAGGPAFWSRKLKNSSLLMAPFMKSSSLHLSYSWRSILPSLNQWLNSVLVCISIAGLLFSEGTLCQNCKLRKVKHTYLCVRTVTHGHTHTHTPPPPHHTHTTTHTHAYTNTHWSQAFLKSCGFPLLSTHGLSVLFSILGKRCRQICQGRSLKGFQNSVFT